MEEGNFAAMSEVDYMWLDCAGFPDMERTGMSGIVEQDTGSVCQNSLLANLTNTDSLGGRSLVAGSVEIQCDL